MLSLFRGAPLSCLTSLKIRRRFLPFFVLLISPAIYPTDYGSGTYTQSLKANGENSTLSGNITINLSSSTPENSAVFATQNGQISGTVDSLNINLFSSNLNGIESQQGAKIDLGGVLN